MALTWGQLKTKLRQTIFPQGEAKNLIPAHDQSFLDAIIDIQTWVKCEQQDNTSIIPQCATFYNCGLTSFDAPQGIIHKVSVIDKAHALPSGNVTASMIGSLVASSAPFFDKSMVGSQIRFADGQTFTIAVFINNMSVAVINKGTDGQNIYFGNNARVNASGNLELYDPDDKLWHEVTLGGGSGDVQIAVNQNGTQ